MATVLTPPSWLARIAQFAVFATVAVVLALVSWRCTDLKLPDLGQFAGLIGSAFVGGVINPKGAGTAGQDAAAAVASKRDVVWIGATVIGAAAIVACALALAVHGERHVNAAAALTALGTAFGALFVDTSKYTHTLDGAAGAGNAGGGG